MAEITCVWCSSTYSAFSDNRRHCKRPECRRKEIDDNLKYLIDLISMILRHKIEADIEIRLPGNDTIGKQAKLNSLGDIRQLIKKEPINNINIQNQIKNLREYFKSLLWKGIKGNFIVKINSGGEIEDIISQETFVTLKDPIVLGNNKIVHSIKGFKSKNQRRELEDDYN